MNTSPSILESHVEVVVSGQTPVELLAAATGLSRGRLKLAMSQGAVWLERGRQVRRLRRARAGLRAGDQLHLYYNAKVQAQRPPPARLIADEGDYSVWDKPCGMYSQGSKWGDHCSLVRWAETQLARESYLVHRLDRAASGLILVAHSRAQADRLAQMFRQRQVEKRYRVRVRGRFPQPGLVLNEALDGKVARSQARLLHYDPQNDHSELEVSIETGRKHQIRRHLAMAGYPVVGDRLYAGDDSDDLQLRAAYLAFGEPQLVYRLD